MGMWYSEEIKWLHQNLPSDNTSITGSGCGDGTWDGGTRASPGWSIWIGVSLRCWTWCQWLSTILCITINTISVSHIWRPGLRDSERTIYRTLTEEATNDVFIWGTYYRWAGKETPEDFNQMQIQGVAFPPYMGVLRACKSHFSQVWFGGSQESLQAGRFPNMDLDLRWPFAFRHSRVGEECRRKLVGSLSNQMGFNNPIICYLQVLASGVNRCPIDTRLSTNQGQNWVKWGIIVHPMKLTLRGPSFFYVVSKFSKYFSTFIQSSDPITPPSQTLVFLRAIVALMPHRNQESYDSCHDWGHVITRLVGFFNYVSI